MIKSLQDFDLEKDNSSDNTLEVDPKSKRKISPIKPKNKNYYDMKSNNNHTIHHKSIITRAKSSQFNQPQPSSKNNFGQTSKSTLRK
jgi:hypothetical protein